MKFKNVNKTKLVVVVIAVIIMGLCLAFLNKAKMGTDPCGIFNLGLASKLGISLGTCQALTNSFMFIFVWLYAKDKIGWGTLANMFLVGYSFDFFTWLIEKFIPADFFAPTLTREEYFATTIFSHRCQPELEGLFKALLQRPDVDEKCLDAISALVEEKRRQIV